MIDKDKDIKGTVSKIDEDMCVEPNWKEECVKLQHEVYRLNRIIAGLHYALYKCVPEGDKIND